MIFLTAYLFVRWQVLSPLFLHASYSHALSSCAREEKDTAGEAEPCDPCADEKGGDPDHGFQCTPPSSRPAVI
jgi:hypothetical protein